jgi:hypothetical protein
MIRTVIALGSIGALGLGLLLVEKLSARGEASPSFLTLPAPAGGVSGLSFDGAWLWVTVEGKFAIYKINPSTGAVCDRFSFPVEATGGSAWDGSSLWQLSYKEKVIYQLDPETLGPRAVIPSPGTGMCCGMAFDGEYLWVVNFEDKKIYQIDQRAGGCVLQSAACDFETTGLAWDGKYLWNGVLVGTKTHDEATPYTGFVQQRDMATGETLRVLPLQGVGPGTSDWQPGRGQATTFWWYDGYHDRIVRVELERDMSSYRPYLTLSLFGLALLAGAVFSHWLLHSRA